ncbi:exonuclease domain-containing protein [Pricia sp. S334]|uniref:Exonuclease domain-containing protein n=1 Tax=Pricia mediterranea TaxID=3076079 RepID=A0ABU3LBM6_9FLAO|nr:exonuclease domain-containing protein [Pricia sp. S334]MDT7830686.1 exonuclease domain-containing protein [Pricia sp. S334]
MYAILDIETTGGKYNEEGITEIAIHKFDGHQVVDQFISLVNPEKEIQPFVVKLTGINNKMLRSAPKFHEVAKRIVEITRDAVLVAHNAQFDYRILRTEFRRLGYNFERKTLCTVDLSKTLIPEADSHSLGKLVRSLGIAVSDRHRANGDALATLKLFKILLSKDTGKTILKETIRKEEHGELSDRQLDIVESIPSETGVYYMHDKDGEIIFLGKSNNMKKRVNQHFTKNGTPGRKLQKATKKVTYERTGSELVAQLKENEELRRNRPKFNRKGPTVNFSHGICTETDENGYFILKIKKISRKNGSFAAFNSAVAAENFIRRLSNEFGLCHKLNGHIKPDLNGKGCGSDACAGACLQKESPKKYNQKVFQAIKKYSLGDKNIVIVDKGREVGEHSAILVKNGHFKGLGYYDLNHQINNTHILESIITPMTGNEVTEHIIETYLRKGKASKILQLSA